MFLGMRLTEPNQLYVYLWKALGGSKVTTEHAKNLLAKRFTTPPTGRYVLQIIDDDFHSLKNGTAWSSSNFDIPAFFTCRLVHKF